MVVSLRSDFNHLILVKWHNIYIDSFQYQIWLRWYNKTKCAQNSEKYLFILLGPIPFTSHKEWKNILWHVIKYHVQLPTINLAITLLLLNSN